MWVFSLRQRLTRDSASDFRETSFHHFMTEKRRSLIKMYNCTFLRALQSKTNTVGIQFMSCGDILKLT